MVPGMKDTPWWLWWLLLLVGLAIVPKLIPAWLRYQLLRTAPLQWGLKNAVPARLTKRSSYLTPRVHLERRRISRIWFVLAISNLIAIPVLTVLTGIVYNRIVIDWLRPPVYSIRVKPAATWHRAEFVISPAYGFQMTIDAVVTFSYSFENADSYDARRQRNEQWISEDRPRLVASYIEMPQGLDQYNWVFTNTGKEDATNIKIKIATVNLNHARHTLVTTPLNVQLRLKPGMVYPVAMAPEKGLQFLVICVAYSNDRGTAFVDLPQFYVTPLYMKSTEPRSEPALVTPLLYEELSAGFSCGDF
jgi:hypothetical protein